MRLAGIVRRVGLHRGPRLALACFALLAAVSVVGRARQPLETAAPPTASLSSASRFAESAAPLIARRTP